MTQVPCSIFPRRYGGALLPAAPTDHARPAATGRLMIVDRAASLRLARAAISGEREASRTLAPPPTTSRKECGECGDGEQERRRGPCFVIFYQNGWELPTRSKPAGPVSPNWHNVECVKTAQTSRSSQGKLLATGGWDYELVQALPPQPGGNRGRKRVQERFLTPTSTACMRARGIRSLYVFTASPTNVCVEIHPMRADFSWKIWLVAIRMEPRIAGPTSPAGSIQHERILGGCPAVEELGARS